MGKRKAICAVARSTAASTTGLPASAMDTLASRSGATTSSTRARIAGGSMPGGKSAITAAAPPSVDTSVPTKRGSAKTSRRSCAISAAVRGTAGINLRTSRSPSTRASRFTRSAAMLQTAPRASSGRASSFVVMPAIFSRTSGRKTSPSRGTIATITAHPPPNVRLISLYTPTYGWVCGS